MRRQIKLSFGSTIKNVSFHSILVKESKCTNFARFYQTSNTNKITEYLAWVIYYMQYGLGKVQMILKNSLTLNFDFVLVFHIQSTYVSFRVSASSRSCSCVSSRFSSSDLISAGRSFGSFVSSSDLISADRSFGSFVSSSDLISAKRSFGSFVV